MEEKSVCFETLILQDFSIVSYNYSQKTGLSSELTYLKFAANILEPFHSKKTGLKSIKYNRTYHLPGPSSSKTIFVCIQISFLVHHFF